MNKVFEIFKELVDHEISHKKVRGYLRDVISKLDSAKKFLHENRGKDFTDAIAKSFEKNIKIGYVRGMISEESVEKTRKLTVIFPGQCSQALYELNKTLLGFGKMFSAASKQSPEATETIPEIRETIPEATGE
jgi:hypothetical protein